MRYIDVTLRDGGHQHGFNWPLEFVNRYLTSINAFPEIGFVELGYWKQKDKFDGSFYSIEEELLSSICKMTKKILSIMVDYHYCSHRVEDFPSNINFNELGLIRVCLRKEWFVIKLLKMKITIGFIQMMSLLRMEKIIIKVKNHPKKLLSVPLNLCQNQKKTQLIQKNLAIKATRN